MGVDHKGVFKDGALDNLPPLRVSCPACIGLLPQAAQFCADCNGTGKVMAPWVADLIDIFEREHFVHRLSK